MVQRACWVSEFIRELGFYDVNNSALGVFIIVLVGFSKYCCSIV